MASIAKEEVKSWEHWPALVWDLASVQVDCTVFYTLALIYERLSIHSADRWRRHIFRHFTSAGGHHGTVVSGMRILCLPREVR
jgi:hypothetical protein